jgi:gliding motility-associated-like protein
VDEPGIYLLTVENSYNGCLSTAAVEVQQDIAAPIAEAGDPVVLNCVDTALPLDGTGSSPGSLYAYAWTTSDGSIQSGQNTPSPVVDATGTYTLVVTNTFNGCTASDLVNVTLNVPTDLEVSHIPPPCFGDVASISIDGVTGGFGPYLYSIDQGETFSNSPTFANLQPGFYGVVVQDINGCEVGLPVEIIEPQELNITLETEAEIKFGDTYQLNAMVNYPLEQLDLIQWTGSDSLSCFDCLNPLAAPTRTTEYQIEVVNENGCRDVAKIQIFVDRRPAIFIPNAFSPNGDGNNERFVIYAKEGVVKNINSLQIFNRWGEMVFEVYDFPPNDEAFGWDGFHRNQEMNTAVFAYWTEIELIDGTVVLYKGDVTLMR